MEIDIIIHLPSTDTGRTQLENKVSEIHADCIEKYMNNMGYSEKEKRNLIEQMIHRQGDKTYENWKRKNGKRKNEKN